MDNVINSIRNLFSTYGFRAGAIIVLTIFIVNLLKKPIVKKAESVATEKGIDKSIITKYITALPVAVAFVLEFAITLVMANFDFTALCYGDIVANAVLYGALAVATYESVKKQLQAYASQKNLTDGEIAKTNPETKKTEVSSVIRFSAND